MELVRVGDKVISLDKIDMAVRGLLALRAEGRSQGEAAARYQLDRAFVSHLESLGALRRGATIAVVGFPVANKALLESVLREVGVDYTLLMTDAERRQFAEERSGIELVNEIMRLAQTVQRYDVVILLASDERLKLLSALVDQGQEVIPWTLGQGPLDADVEVDVERMRMVVEACKQHILEKTSVT